MTTTSNTGKFASREAPTEPFKRAVTSCLRAIAKQPELEVSFAADEHGPITRLTLVHANLADEEEREALASGWSAVLANLKTFLETGESL